MGDLRQTLRELHTELEGADRLGPEDRALLETVLGDIQRVLEGPASTATASTVTAAAHGDTLDGAAVRLEAGHPGLAGAIRAVLDALAKAGI